MRASSFTKRFVVAVLASVLVTGHASATVRQDVDLTMNDANAMDAVIVQEWSDEDAKDFRRSLDVLFGDDDGALNASEIDRIVSATKDDMEGATLPLVRVDNVTARVVQVAVVLEGAEGDVNATGAVTLRHEVTLAFADVTSAREHVVRVTPLRGGFLSLMAPAGWEIVGSENLGTPQNAAGMLGGQFDGEAPVLVTLRDPSVPAPDPVTENGNADDGAGTGASDGDSGTPTGPDADASAPSSEDGTDTSSSGNPAGAFLHALRGLATSIIALGQAITAPLPAWARGLFVAGFLGVAAGGGAWLASKRGWDDSQE